MKKIKTLALAILLGISTIGFSQTIQNSKTLEQINLQDTSIYFIKISHRINAQPMPTKVDIGDGNIWFIIGNDGTKVRYINEVHFNNSIYKYNWKVIETKYKRDKIASLTIETNTYTCIRTNE